MKTTGSDFSALLPYDGFSEFESATCNELVDILDSLEDIRM
jgi:hypothetical protein